MTTKGIWEIIQKQHIVGKGFANKKCLKQFFFMFWMESFDAMEPHLKKFKKTINKLDAIETTILEEVKVMFYHL
jgi:hypothetical protein